VLGKNRPSPAICGLQSLKEVILLGHSYGGMVITGVADCMPNRIAHIIYLDTFVPQDGEAMTDIVPIVIKRFRRQARTHGDGWRADPMLKLPFGARGLYGVTEEPDLS
jgi:pimeloyl-ACP methyl ester carboxylesterase